MPAHKHAKEPKGERCLALTGKDAVDLSGLLKARGECRELMLNLYRDRPPVVPLTSRADYPELLVLLDGVLLSSTENPRWKTASQAGLFYTHTGEWPSWCAP